VKVFDFLTLVTSIRRFIRSTHEIAMTQFLLLLLIPLAACFNISPSPNIIIQKPALTTFITETRSSYFGYAINLRKNSVLIGAPRAQSTLATQRKVNETGAIFKCNFEDDQQCHPYHFDLNGNTRVENSDSDYNSEKKDHQMLGATMDGHGSESDKFVVCAPKLKADVEEADHYLLHGTCYWVSDTNSTQPSGVRQITPLKQRKLQTLPSEDGKLNHYYYIYGESGFSVHITDDSEEIIIGCPGIYNWRGSIIRYKKKELPNLGGLSRRDLSTPNHSIRKRQIFEYRSEIPNPYFTDLTDDSYFGYAVSSGYFMGPTVRRLFYVASAPQANKQSGKVFLFDIEDFQFQKKIKVFNHFAGTQMGEYFGYTLLTEDFNNDGLPDLAISAPFYSKSGLTENGAVYVFINEGNVSFN
jgi:FG-GAP repeat